MGALPLTGLSSSSDPQGVSLWIPPATGAVAAVVVTGIGAFLAFNASGYKARGIDPWLRSTVYAGPAWSPSDSWATNLAGVGGILAAVITAASSGFGSVLTSDAVVAITTLFLVFSGTAALAPITYGALATQPSPDTTIEKTNASVWGFLAAATVTMTAVMGELATVALLVWQASSSTAGKIILIVFLIIGAILSTLYTFKTVRLFAAPQPATDQPRISSAQQVMVSMLGNARSGTL